MAVADIDATSAKAISDSVTDQGGTAIHVQVDVTNSDSVQQMIQTVIAAWVRWRALLIALESLVQSCRWGPTTRRARDHVNNVNLRGAFLCTKYEIAEFDRCGTGSIVNIVSTAGVGAPQPGLAAYISSKHGVVGLTSQLPWIMRPKVFELALCARER